MYKKHKLSFDYVDGGKKKEKLWVLIGGDKKETEYIANKRKGLIATLLIFGLTNPHQ